MLEDSALVMEKKGVPRQTSSKPTTAIERKNDPGNTPRLYGRHNRRRDNGSGRGTPPADFSNRKPLPQKTRTALDKRPRQRGGYGGRQREEVAAVLDQPADGRIQKADGRHLLNFVFADREHAPASRQYRQKSYGRKKTYSKEQYLQANCQFVVKNTGDYSVQACDPDALVSWDLVEQVRTFSFGHLTCPICLHPPAAGKITRCGHVYCWACMLHYLSLEEKGVGKCPICDQRVSKSDLRSVKVVEKKEHKVGDMVTLKLMKRARDSTYAVPIDDWQDRHGQPQHIQDKLGTEYAKVLTASASEIHAAVIDEERQALMNQMTCAEDSEICFIETALMLLTEREQSLAGQSKASEENAAAMEMLMGGSDSASTSGGPDNSNSSSNSSNSTKPLASAPVPVPKPLPKNLSFDGSKIRKQYADAFDELEDEDEEEDEEESVMSEDDAESTDSLVSVSSPSLTDQLMALTTAASHLPATEERVSMGSDEGLAVALAGEEEEEEEEGGSTLTTEEAVEQLALPADTEAADTTTITTISNDNDNNTVSVTNTNTGATAPYKAAGPNQSKRYFYFYQASDGQHIYLQSINARCLIHQYGSLENGPHTITARIVDKDVLFMKEELRKRVRYLSHVPNACEFQVVEVQLRPPTVSNNTLRHFQGELRKRQRHRQKVRSEDRRMAKKQNIQEKMSYGIYPEVRLALDSTDHFPAPAPEVSERRRNSSLTDVTTATTTTTAAAAVAASSSPSPSPSHYTTDLNGNTAEYILPSKTDTTPPSTPSTFSFAAALKKAKQPTTSGVWGGAAAAGATAAPAAGPPPPPHRADSEESDNEDRVPVPRFQNSFSQAISAKLDTLDTVGAKADGGESGGQGGGSKKKKKKEKVLLFSTHMMRR